MRSEHWLFVPLVIHSLFVPSVLSALKFCHTMTRSHQIFRVIFKEVSDLSSIHTRFSGRKAKYCFLSMKLISFIPKGKEEVVTVPDVRDTTIKKGNNSWQNASLRGHWWTSYQIDGRQRERVIAARSVCWQTFLSFLLHKSSEEQSTNLLLVDARSNHGKHVLCGFWFYLSLKIHMT